MAQSRLKSSGYSGEFYEFLSYKRLFCFASSQSRLAFGMARETLDLLLEEIEECWPLVSEEETRQTGGAACSGEETRQACGAARSIAKNDEIKIRATISVHPSMATFMLRRCQPSSTLEIQDSHPVETERQDDSIAIVAERRNNVAESRVRTRARADGSISSVEIEGENANAAAANEAQTEFGLPNGQLESQTEHAHARAHSQSWAMTLVKLYEMSAAVIIACLPVIMCIAITLSIILFFEYYDQ